VRDSRFYKVVFLCFVMRKFILMLGLILMLGVVSAGYDSGYKESFSEVSYHGGKVFSKMTTWVDYENDRRYSTDDYQYGYSYRGTRDYFERQYGLDEDRYDGKYERDYGYERDYDRYEENKYEGRYSRDYDSYEESYEREYEDRYGEYEESYERKYYDRYERESYRYDYVPHLRTYEKTACYVNPPRDKLFYVKC